MKTENISIVRFKNTSDKKMHFMFAGFTFHGFKHLDVESQGERDIDIPLHTTEPVFIKIMVAEGGVLNSHTVRLTYHLEDSGNQFYYQVLEESTEKQPVKGITSAGSNVRLELWYSGDGVVIVGTGDM